MLSGPPRTSGRGPDLDLQTHDQHTRHTPQVSAPRRRSVVRRVRHRPAGSGASALRDPPVRCRCSTTTSRSPTPFGSARVRLRSSGRADPCGAAQTAIQNTVTATQWSKIRPRVSTARRRTERRPRRSGHHLDQVPVRDRPPGSQRLGQPQRKCDGATRMKALVRRTRGESGQALVFVVVVLFVLVGMAALVIDGGSWYRAQRQLQRAADAAALAGAQELPNGVGCKPSRWTTRSRTTPHPTRHVSRRRLPGHLLHRRRPRARQAPGFFARRLRLSSRRGRAT